ncbi:MAG: aminoacyl-histidine dipeptidase, partial [Bacteroidales bacterium]|nr:aminoacyl-histidine dipeptidase [Bacteroidales bacterium]
MSIRNLEPKGLWKNFYELTQIPRPSKKEEKVVAFVKEFGEKLGLETIVDSVGNVIIRKPATPGYENRMGVILQAHLDMVPQKNSDKVHDFEKDPIETHIENGWVKANGTTLGADNGVGAAAAMAVLEDNTLVHGPIEALFTIDEETGMTGANALESGVLKGEILINTDSETEGELYVGCAGGIDTCGYFTPKFEEVPAGSKAFQLVVKGLKGGHSGMDIILGRANANKVMNELLAYATEKLDARVADIQGGSLRNAIPRESFVTVTVPEGKAEELTAYVSQFEASTKEKFAAVEPEMSITIAPTEMPAQVMDKETVANIIEAVAKYPNGVTAMSKDFEGTVETSSNLAIVKLIDGTVMTASLQRSLVDASKEALAAEMRELLEKCGARAESTGSYPGWKPNINSPILHTMKKVYEEKYGKTPKIMVIHAGLECGILGSKYPNWDMVSFGPTLVFPHSPDEALKIDTVPLFWEFMTETLKNVPVK